MPRYLYLMPAGDEGTPGAAPTPSQSADDMKKMIAEQVNGAVVGLLRKGAFKEQLAEAVKASVSESVAAIKDALPDLLKGMIPQTPPTGDPAKTGAELPPEVKAALAKAEADTKAMRDLVTNEQKLRKDMEDQTKRKDERDAITIALRKNGVTEANIKVLTPYLHGESGRVKRDKEGNVVFTIQRDWGTEETPIEAGLTEWLTKTEDGKSYMPPVGTSGTGVGGTPGIQVRPGQKLTESQQNAGLGAALMSSFLNGGK